MTSKREELALIICCEENGDDGCKDRCIHPAQGSHCPYERTVDAILDALMETEIEEFEGMNQFVRFDGMPREWWQAILTHIKGKP